MLRLKTACISIVLANALGNSEAFQGPIPSTIIRSHDSSSRTTPTQLSAMVAPPFIIGGLVRRFREKEAEKNQKMATREEAKANAPGLKVGEKVWKWPQIWPYDNDFFTPPQDSEKKDQAPTAPTAQGIASMVTGIPETPVIPNATETEEIKKLDPLEYWGEEMKEVTTDLDSDAAEQLASHYAFYLKDGMSVLELGAAEKSYLPKSLKLSRHVGVGANQYLMDQNPALTEKLVVDLNNAIPDGEVDNEDLRSLAQEPFDAIIMANTVDFLTRPREVYRTAWYLLKPGGLMLTAFSTKDMYGNKFERANTKMWVAYNDDQHMWICGSFYAFSAGDGWEKLLGFDISPESAKENADGVLKQFKKGKNNNIYVVQAKKTELDEKKTAENVEYAVDSNMWMIPKVEPRDKNLVKERLIRSIETAQSQTSEDMLDTVRANTKHIPEIYDALVKMDQFAFTFSMQSQLAAELICNPMFTASEEQIIALKQGLGLRTPSEDFWLPVGMETAAMNIEDKISILANIVARFDSGDPQQEEALKAFVTALKPTLQLLRSRLPEVEEGDIQLLGVELLAAEVLEPGRSTRFEFATWINALDNEDLKEYLSSRKQIRVDAEQEKTVYQEQRAAAIKYLEEREKKRREQIDKAREERSMIYNVRTEKFEAFENKKKK